MSSPRKLYVAWREDHESAEPDEIFAAGYAAGGEDMRERLDLAEAIVEQYHGLNDRAPCACCICERRRAALSPSPTPSEASDE